MSEQTNPEKQVTAQDIIIRAKFIKNLPFEKYLEYYYVISVGINCMKAEKEEVFDFLTEKNGELREYLFNYNSILKTLKSNDFAFSDCIENFKQKLQMLGKFFEELCFVFRGAGIVK